MVLGVHLGPVRSEAAAPETRNTLFLSRTISLTASATEDVGTSTMTSTLSTSIQVRTTFEPKSSTAIRAAMTEPWPLRSEYVPDMSFMTPILMLPSLYCACAQPHPNTTASAVRPNNRFIRHPPVKGF